MHYRLPLYIVFGLLPSLIWLAYYLRKDCHPEPKKMIVKVFLLGALVTIPVFFIQISLSEIIRQLQEFLLFPGAKIIFAVLKWFVAIAFIEEIFKYFAAKKSALKSRELDEPTDAMIYMIVAALGFAALENILYMFSPLNTALTLNEILKTTLTISFIRFVGATFVHALASGFLGYFLAKSFLLTHKRRFLIWQGILGATLLHGFYNFFIISLKEPFNVAVSLVTIIAAALFISYAFKKIRYLKSICDV